MVPKWCPAGLCEKRKNGGTHWAVPFLGGENGGKILLCARVSMGCACALIFHAIGPNPSSPRRTHSQATCMFAAKLPSATDLQVAVRHCLTQPSDFAGARSHYRGHMVSLFSWLYTSARIDGPPRFPRVSRKVVAGGVGARRSSLRGKTRWLNDEAESMQVPGLATSARDPDGRG